MGDGFRRVVELLGRGLLAHPANLALRRKLAAGTLTPRGYRDELTLLAYRIVLLVAADERGRLASILARGAFHDGELAELRGCKLSGGDLLEAICRLTPVPGATELAAVHEEMLAAEPALNVKRRSFEVMAATGAQRRHTGSYYTPAALVESLLDSTVEPVMDEAVERARRAGGSARQVRRRIEAALLALRICDPACGAGHFLVAAARRLARRLAAERAGRALPSPAQMRTAWCDVVERCIYGVDISRTAVALCKLALRLELLDAGARKWVDLRERIVCGNALMKIPTDGAARDAGVFAWRSAFPHVFDSAGGRDTCPCGFDAVIGNPPYRATRTERERQVARRLYPLAAPASNSAADFVELGSRIVRPDGRVGLVVPKSLTYSYSWRTLRAALAPGVVSAIDVRRGWDDVLLEQVLLTFRPEGRRGVFIRVGVLRAGVAARGRLDARWIERLGILPTGLNRDEVKLLECMLRNSRGMLSEVCTTRRGTGLQRRLQPEGNVPVVGGRDITAFGRLRPRAFVRRADVPAEMLRWTEPPQAIFQNIIAHVTRPVEHIRLIGTVARERVACLDTVNLLTIREPALSPAGLCALLMSELVQWYVYACVYNKAVRTMHFDGYFLAKIPIPEGASLGALGRAAEELEGAVDDAEGWKRINRLVYEAYGVPGGLLGEGRLDRKARPGNCRTNFRWDVRH